MSKNQEKRPWSAQEIEYLKIGFQMKTRLKIIAKVLNRSETSVNKALSRFGIRPYGLKGRLKNDKNVLSDPTEISFKKALDKHCQNSEGSSFFLNVPKKSKIFKPVKQGKKKSKLPFKSSLNYEYLWSNKMPKTKDLQEDWHDFDFAVNFLRTIGDRVSYSCANLKRKTLFINGKPFTAQQMLLRLNRSRLQSGLNPIYVANITEF